MKRSKHAAKGLHVSHNKRYYAFFTLLTVGLLVIGSTFSWVSWYQWKKNHLQGEPHVATPSVMVKGTLGPQQLTHQTSLTRNVTVQNNGQLPVFVRVSLIEELITFEVDTSDRVGNGHLKEYPTLPGGSTELQRDVESTWQIGTYFKRAGSSTYVKSVGKATYPYRLSEGGRPTVLTPIKMNFGKVDPFPVLPSGYWLYEEQGGTGYYYYSDILQVGEETTQLVTTLELLETAPNTLKGGLHHIEVAATGGHATDGIFAEWGIPETIGHKLYDRYRQELQ